MKFIKNIVIILLLLMAHQHTMAYGTPKLFSFEETSLSELSGESTVKTRIFLKRSFRSSENKIALAELNTTSAFYKQTVIRKQKSSSTGNDLLTKLIRSNLKLSFRVSKTLNLSISYL